MMSTIDSLVRLAISEDGVFNDITTKGLGLNGRYARAVLVANEPGILCGTGVFIKVFKTIDKDIKVSLKMEDCSRLKRGDEILEISGSARAILSGERVALNFLQYLSGIATITNKFVKSLKNEKTRIYDTRKTVPGYRELAKYAVKCGGGVNHRMGLSDMVLIKDNHLKIIENLTAVVKKFKEKYKNIPVEVECESIKELKQALDAKVDIIMLDNVPLGGIKKMMHLIEGKITKKYRPEIEISGGVTLETAKEFSKLNVDRISIGMITHSPKALDCTLEITMV